jgi:hypothetical protein
MSHNAWMRWLEHRGLTVCTMPTGTTGLPPLLCNNGGLWLEQQILRWCMAGTQSGLRSHGEWLELEHHCLGPIMVCTMTETPGHLKSQGLKVQCGVWSMSKTPRSQQLLGCKLPDLKSYYQRPKFSKTG